MYYPGQIKNMTMTMEIEKVEIDEVLDHVSDEYEKDGWTLMDGEVVFDDGTVFETVEDMRCL